MWEAHFKGPVLVLRGSRKQNATAVFQSLLPFHTVPVSLEKETTRQPQISNWPCGRPISRGRCLCYGVQGSKMEQVFFSHFYPSTQSPFPLKRKQPASLKSPIGHVGGPFQGAGACAMGFKEAENTYFILRWYLDFC